MPLPVPVDLPYLEKLAADVGTPYQLYDEASIRSNARGLLSAFRGAFGDTFSQFYAVKALPNPAILRVLIEEGCGLDCSSTAELHIAKILGVPGRQVMYTSNYTSKADLATAFDQGVVINLDDVSLVADLKAVRGRTPDLICFRLNPGLGRTDSETASNVLGGPDAKFGVPADQIVEAYRQARAAGSTRFGMHMMTGSCVLSDSYWEDTVAVLLRAVGQVQRELGITFEFINIGGGLGIPYRPEQPPVDIPALAARLRHVMTAAAAREGLAGLPRLCMENGRYMTGPFGWLVSRCEVVKRSYATYLGLDACMANLMRPGMYGSYHHITVPAKEDEAKFTGAGAAGVEGAAASGVPRAVVNVVGTLCENNDWFAKDRSLPASAGLGDLFVIHDTGAHAHSMGFQYNGKLRAPELLLRPDGSVSVIRERETMESLYGNCRMPVDLQAPIRTAAGSAGSCGTHGPSGVAAGAVPTYDATPAVPFPYGQKSGTQTDAARGTCAVASPCETAPCALEALRLPRLGACVWVSRERAACVVAAIAVGALAAASFAWGRSRSRK